MEKIYKKLRSKTLLAVLSLSFLMSGLVVQGATYYLVTTNKAELPASWNTIAGGGGTAATNFTTSGDVFIISAAQTNIGFANATFGAGVTLQIDGTIIINNAKTLTINGILKFTDAGAAQMGGNGTLTIDPNATIITNNTNGIQGSNCSITAAVTPLTIANYEFNGIDQSTTGLPATVNNLTMSGGGAKTIVSNVNVNGEFDIKSTVTVTISTGVTVGGSGTLLIESILANVTGNLVVNGTFSMSGTKSVQRYLPNSSWYIISSPVQGETLNGIATLLSLPTNASNKYPLAPYNESTDSWDYTPDTDNTTEFEAGKGYTILDNTGNTTMTFQGSSIDTGTQIVSVDSTIYGWNALGNPYTSSISIDQFLADNNAAITDAYGAVYVWNGSLTTPDYDVMNTGNLAVGQGFIVRAAASGTMEFNSNQQVASPSTMFKSANTPLPELTLTVKSGNLENYTRVNFSETATTGLNKFQDIGKLKGNSNIALFTRLVDGNSDIDFAVQALANQDFDEMVIPVGLDLPGGGETTFKLEMTSFPENARVYIHDKETNGKVELSIEDSEYSVELPSINGADRFELLVENFKSGQITTGIDENIEKSLNVYSGKGKIIISGTVSREAQFSVYGIDGRLMVKSMASNANRNEIDATGFPDGIYLVRIDDAGKMQTNKVIVNK